MQPLSVAPASRDFMGQGGVCDDMSADSPIMVNVVVIQKCEEASNFDVQTADLLFGAFKAKVHDGAFTIGNLGPIQGSNILPSVT